MIELFMVWSLATTLFYTMLNNKGEEITNSIDYEIGFLVGSKQAVIDGVLDSENIQAGAIKTWIQAQNSIILDLVEYSAGFISGYNAYLNGIV